MSDSFSYSFADLNPSKQSSALSKNPEQEYRDAMKEAQIDAFKKYLDSFDNQGGASEQDTAAYVCLQQSLQTVGQLLMQYLQIQSILNVPKEDRPDDLDQLVSRVIPPVYQNATNIFEDILGEGWSEKFNKYIINNGTSALLFGIDQLATEINNSNLSTSKKELAHQFLDVARDAFCLNGPSKRLLKIMRESKGIVKIFNNENRLMRAIESLDLVLKRLKIYRIVVSHVPIFFTGMTISYNWRYKLATLANHILIKDENQAHKSKQKKDNISQMSRMFVPGVLLGVILAEYAKKINSNDYLSMWYVAMLIKFLEIESFVPQYQQAAGPQLVRSANIFFDIMDTMIDKYCMVLPTPEALNQYPIEVQEMDLRVPTKEEWEILKLPPEEQERIMEQQKQETMEKYESYKEQENIVELPPISNSSSKNNDKKDDDYVTIGKDIQITL